MRKRKTKDSNMILKQSNWLSSHSNIYLLKCFTILALISVIVVNVNGSDVEKPLIVENYTVPSLSFTPLDNSTSRSVENKVNHQATVGDKALDVTTISSYDSMEDDDLSGEMLEGVPSTVVR